MSNRVWAAAGSDLPEFAQSASIAMPVDITHITSTRNDAPAIAVIEAHGFVLHRH
jgi:hypothetical protein